MASSFCYDKSMIEIKDNGEPLVEISKYCPNFINGLDPVRLKNENKLFLRKTVAQMLGKASKSLPLGVTFRINDAWRPYEVQKHYYKLFYNRVKKNHPTWGKKRLTDYASKYVINPNDIKRAGHLTGAAVDIVLCKNGKKLPMQSLNLEQDKRNMTSFKQLSDYINFNRQLLLQVMTNVGFANYPEEYWHYSYGDTMWAEHTNHKVAFYGVIR
jgi:D-alanyl-D-alanine dipeptidase